MIMKNYWLSKENAIVSAYMHSSLISEFAEEYNSKNTNIVCFLEKCLKENNLINKINRLIFSYGFGNNIIIELRFDTIYFGGYNVNADFRYLGNTEDRFNDKLASGLVMNCIFTL